MTMATERIPVLVTVDEKKRIAKKAKDAGLSMGELLRRAAVSYRQSEEDEALEAMISQMLKSTRAANAAIDDALAYIAQTDKRIAAMEAKHAAARKARHKAKAA
ncbi:MAG: plasmid mobilization protein [Pseudomonadota bacterium]